jgi:hypothetical protein
MFNSDTFAFFRSTLFSPALRQGRQNLHFVGAEIDSFAVIASPDLSGRGNLRSRLLRRFAPRNDILPKITKVAQKCKSSLITSWVNIGDKCH